MSDAKTSNLSVSKDTTLRPIIDVAADLGLSPADLYLYGPYMAKVTRPPETAAPQGQLVLVSAINPTPAGEGKTTTSVGLTQALRKAGANACIALREPSLGPVFGIKGGGCGGGHSQVLPMEEINLHFTGDLHAITSAHNLLSAMIDNELHFRTRNLDLEYRDIQWPRVMDMNDRSLRQVTIGLGGRLQGVPREDRFDITAASEVMAILALAADLEDLEQRLGNIMVGHNHKMEPIYARDLQAQGAMTMLLRQALLPNLVQTVEGVPAFVHAGPFANIAHGCNSIIATKTALGLADIVVTEAGFGFDLGAEKFINIKCRTAGLFPDAIVLVATTQALKMHGGVPKKQLKGRNDDALRAGLTNIDRHLSTARSLGINPVVSINHFADDSDEEMQIIVDHCQSQNVACAVSRFFSEGGSGGLELAGLVQEALKQGPSEATFTYELQDSVETKIEKIVQKVYGGEGVKFSKQARKHLREIKALGYTHLPVCMAKTQYSLSDDQRLVGRPEGFTVGVRELRLNSGSGFIVAMTGNIMSMPGLPRRPAACEMGLDEDGKPVGMF